VYYVAKCHTRVYGIKQLTFEAVSGNCIWLLPKIQVLKHICGVFASCTAFPHLTTLEHNHVGSLYYCGVHMPSFTT
jgi:hypothetical protein